VAISGTVADAVTGLPLSGINLSIYDSRGSPVTGATTDASGAYTTSAVLLTGTYYATANEGNRSGYTGVLYDGIPCDNSKNGGCRFSATTGTPISVTVGSVASGINFSLTPPGKIAGTVLDAATSTPLANAQVLLFNSGGGQVAAGYTDASGHYSSTDYFTTVPTGTYYAYAGSPAGFL